MRQNEFPVVIGTPHRDIGRARYYIATDFRGSGDPDRVSGTCAREEGLRTLTSPRREASLFKLGRSLVLRPFSFVELVCRVPRGSQPAFSRGCLDTQPSLPECL